MPSSNVGLNVVALISGGKDSFFSILHCHANGNNVVALANLHPPEVPGGESVEDLDSFMYQTIGHKVIPLYGDALGLPLYRSEIRGTAVIKSKEYDLSFGANQLGRDEIQDLFELLSRVKAAQPEINAVSTGAILSDYQRVRVEHVALRLGLTPLAFLWQYPSLPPRTQHSLLEDMGAVGQDSRIIKVASGGLDESFLWQNVASKQTIQKLRKAVTRFGAPDDGAVLGEGGEFETLAIRGPSPLWKCPIVIEEAGIERQSGEGGTASIKVLHAKLGERFPHSDVSLIENLRRPQLLDDHFQTIMDRNFSHNAHQDAETKRNLGPELMPRNIKLLTNLTCHEGTAAEQIAGIMDILQSQLRGLGLNLDAVAYVVVILRDMRDFSRVNDAYRRYFVKPNPPARLTIACASVLPTEASVAISATITDTNASHLRKGLHVQSRSYWAPANIGPYSQAIAVPAERDTDPPSTLLYVAGQIPLLPASMDLVQPRSEHGSDAFKLQAVLSLQHLYRIGEHMSIRYWVGAIAFVAPSDAEEAGRMAAVAQDVWKNSIASDSSEGDEEDHDEEFDVWHMKHGFSHRPLPDETASALLHAPVLPSLSVVKVDGLPRNSSIEWAAYGSADERPLDWQISHLQYLLNIFEANIVLPDNIEP